MHFPDREAHSLYLRGRLPFIGAGDARAKLEAGAVLVQVYTGLVKEIVKEL